MAQHFIKWAVKNRLFFYATKYFYGIKNFYTLRIGFL